MIEGAPDVWIDGELFRLAPGDGVGFPAGTGIAHSFLNNTDEPVRLLVVGEANKDENRIVYPVNRELRAHRIDWWDDAPVRSLGPHDGKPRRPDDQPSGNEREFVRREAGKERLADEPDPPHGRA